MIQRALLSVSDKTGLIELAQCLQKKQIEIIASGGTAKYLEQAGFNVTPVEKITGSPEAFGGRMKTISFQIGSALLYRRGNEEDVRDAKKLGIQPIDLVVVNLYPFQQTVAKNSPLSDCIENIDIGGPTMIRAAAKNFESVTVLTSPKQYSQAIREIQNSGDTTLQFRKHCAREVFSTMAFYDLSIATYLTEEMNEQLRYGENSHQKAVLLKNPFTQTGLAHTKILHGKEMSYNNYLDSEFAMTTLRDLNQWMQSHRHPAAVVVKHNIPCGIAIAETPLQALQLAWDGDSKSSFGSVIAVNFELRQDEIQFLNEHFVEVILAPEVDRLALQKLDKKSCRVAEYQVNNEIQKDIRSIDSGLLIQDVDQFEFANYKSVTRLPLADQKMRLAEFAFLCVKNLKSNAISIVREEKGAMHLLTMGAGQCNRVDCIEKLIAPRLKEKQIQNISDCVLGSDAFFPFADSIEAAHKLGIKIVVQPGGSVKDADVIAKANELNMTMVFTGRRHFRH